MTNNWAQSGSVFQLREVSRNVKLLKPGIYKLEQDPMGQLYLNLIKDKYEFPYKVYGIEDEFIKRVVKSYKETKGNLGVLLTGVKGTGKTVTSKQLCNILDMPVILIHERYDKIPSFINEIQQDVIIFVDEYEKIYDRDHSVLTIMDGAMDNGYRRVFLLTSNSMYVNDNMIQRPGRIRYIKKYGDLPLDIIVEIVEDRLIHKELKKETIEYISQLEIITVDIVKAIIDEVNIHKEDPIKFKDVFNATMKSDLYDVYEILTDKSGKKSTKLLYSDCKLNVKSFSDELVKKSIDLEVNRITELGTIVEVKDAQTAICRFYDDKKHKHALREIRIEPKKSYHSSFYGYAF